MDQATPMKLPVDSIDHISKPTPLSGMPRLTAILMNVIGEGFCARTSKHTFNNQTSTSSYSEALGFDDALVTRDVQFVVNLKDIGSWLAKIELQKQTNLIEYDSPESEIPLIENVQFPDVDSQKSNYNEAIKLLLSWIAEEPEENQVESLKLFKITVDEQRIEESKLFE